MAKLNFVRFVCHVHNAYIANVDEEEAREKETNMSDNDSIDGI